MKRDRVTDDTRFIRRCIELARRGIGRVEPNPAVGCVIVRDGAVIAEGWHQEFGKAHAEIHALRKARSVRGATLYVSLEPCSTQGKTPPCTRAIIKAGIARVVFGAADSGQDGRLALLKAGVRVKGGMLAEECRALNPYFFRLPRTSPGRTRRPFVMAKWAMSMDGRLKTPPGESSWISCEESRRLVHRWRGTVDAICVGVGTVLADDALLTCRVGLSSPRRVVFDSEARTPPSSRLVAGAGETPVIIVVAPGHGALIRAKALEAAGCRLLRARASSDGIDMLDALRLLHRECSINTLMIEGGSRVLSSAFKAGVVDETRIFVAPVAFGDRAGAPDLRAMEALAQAMQSAHTVHHRCCDDLLLITRRMR